MEIFKAKAIKKMLFAETMGLELNQIKNLIDSELEIDFSVVEVLEESDKGNEKFKIHVNINDSNRIRSAVLTSQKKIPRRLTIKTAVEILREYGVKSFQVILEKK